MIKKDIFIGHSLVKIYNNILYFYPHGVNFVSTTQKLYGNIIEYTITVESKETKHNQNKQHIENEAFKKFKGKLLAKGLDYDWLENISDKIIENGFSNDIKLAMNYIIDEIESEILINNNKTNICPKIIMMVGTTGVGKTTTIAKLAAKFKTNSYDTVDISFLNLDHYRVASSEQLKMYANIAGASYEDIYDSVAFNSKLQSLSENSVVFIDTAGVAPVDIAKILETISYINDAHDIKIEISLVMPATFKKEDLIYAYNHFSFLNLTSLIITKFDETSSITGLVDFLRTCPAKLDYFSIGQKVPNDIIDANSDYIIERLRDEWLEINEK
jgi:flagellar biosynthesis protein FlhF